ncbi:hypothetical protein VNO77_01602 [Canavalia gladiata]|uniref:Uncharacterized protein n=1 Tax=Canavalia gladiata TaxID=3824 RepID=A0AAN9MRI9_CANGL
MEETREVDCMCLQRERAVVTSGGDDDHKMSYERLPGEEDLDNGVQVNAQERNEDSTSVKALVDEESKDLGEEG